MGPNTGMSANPTGTAMSPQIKAQAVNENKDNDGTVTPEPEFRLQIVWSNVVFFTFLHLGALYGIYIAYTSSHMYTNLFATAIGTVSGFGITAGAHRLWAHRSYKATWQLQVILLILYTLAWENLVITWVRDHRVHHKYTETHADPHNSLRGFFFAHMGWLLCKKHPDVTTKGKGVDLSDLEKNPILVFQRKYWILLLLVIWVGLPTLIPVYMWNESWKNAFFVATNLRYTLALHFTWLVNSAAHYFGDQPYDKSLNPRQNWFVSIFAVGEGWHNYHHVFPWDYKAAEFGNYELNWTNAFIDFFAWIGWAYDLKTVPVDAIEKRVKRTGDGTHAIWGWGDKDQPEEERISAVVLNSHKMSMETEKGR